MMMRPLNDKKNTVHLYWSFETFGRLFLFGAEKKLSPLSFLLLSGGKNWQVFFSIESVLWLAYNKITIAYWINAHTIAVSYVMRRRK